MQPPSSMRPGALTGFTEAAIVIEELPEALRGVLKHDEIEKWIWTRVESVGIRAISVDQQDAEYEQADKNTDEEKYAALIRACSAVSLHIESRRGLLAVIVGARNVSLILKCKRGPDQHGFPLPVTAWEGFGVVPYSPRINPTPMVRQQLDRLLGKLEMDWKSCNH